MRIAIIWSSDIPWKGNAEGHRGAVAVSVSQSVAAPAHARHRVGGMLAVAAFLCLTLLVFAPAQIYYGNVTEFANAFPDMLRLLGATALLGTVLLTAVLVALPSGRIRDAGITALVTVAFLFWFQSTVLVWPYGVLDGRPIDWAAHRHHGLIDATVWCLVLAGAAVAFRFVSRIAVRASVAFILIQAVGVSIQAARSPDRWIDHVAFDDSERFSFSHDRNVVILVLDTFQSDLFQELLDEDPGMARRFRGFTYFRNAIGGFPGTAASIPLILSGRHYDNAVPFQDFVKSTYRTASLPKALKAAGFHVYYNNPYYWPCLYADETIASHVREKAFVRFDSELWPMVRRLIGFGLSRSLPQAGKRFLDTNRVLSLPARSAAAIPLRGDALFFKGIADGAATMKTPTFKYYHLWGIHPPLVARREPAAAPAAVHSRERQAPGQGDPARARDCLRDAHRPRHLRPDAVVHRRRPRHVIRSPSGGDRRAREDAAERDCRGDGELVRPAARVGEAAWRRRADEGIRHAGVAV